MNVEIGTQAAQFPEKEYINGIFVAVRYSAYFFYFSLDLFFDPCLFAPFDLDPLSGYTSDPEMNNVSIAHYRKTIYLNIYISCKMCC
jgi:hypothetical protein